MTFYDRFTGKPVDRLSDFLPSTLRSFCEEGHPETHLISNCPQCGAPVCCPKCCDETEREFMQGIRR